MDSKIHKARREYWRRIVQECNNREPGISKSQWLRDNGIGSKTYYYWQKLFRSDAVSTIETSLAVQDEPATSFFDITESLSVCNPIDNSKGRITSGPLIPELMIQRNDCQIYVSGAVQEHTLDVVMRVLRHD